MQSHEVFAGLETFPQNMKTCTIHKNAQLVAQERILVGQLDSLERHIQEVDDVDALPQSQLLDDEGWSNHSEPFEDPASIKLQSLRLTSWDGARLLAAKAKVQLELYNKKWHNIHATQAPASASAPVGPRTVQQIPWPLILSEKLGRALHRTESSTKSYLNFAWNAHELFCLAFDFIPSWNNQGGGGSDAVFNFVSYDDENRTRNLKDLREQLKLEKVRWHEDKVKRLFGEEAVKDERVKVVWKVVMDLKARVGDELEELEGCNGPD